MSSITLYKNTHEVTNRLSHFGVTREELKSVALEAAAARDEATPLHPTNAPGMYAYLAGVAAKRMLFLQKPNWNKATPMGIEAVENKFLGITILFCNVENACGIQDPRPISKKGPGAKKLLDNPTMYLWDYMEREDKGAENEHVWFLCVSYDGEIVKAELSRPKSVEGSYFGLFLERIFVLTDEDCLPPNKDYEEDVHEIDDFEIVVTKK